MPPTRAERLYVLTQVAARENCPAHLRIERKCNDRTKILAVAPHSPAPARRRCIDVGRSLVPGGGLACHAALGRCARVPGTGCSQVRKGLAKGILAVPPPPLVVVAWQSRLVPLNSGTLLLA